MRLINTKTLRISEFFGDDIPPYAILSHTWGRDEPTYQEWKMSYDPPRQPSAEDNLERGHGPALGNRPGIAKIHGCVRLASAYFLDWAWVDTVCIDKTSSAELTEAINSMYSWYRDSVVCYAFLEDVSATPEDDPEFESQFRRSKWFTRGWTLQELIAPRRLDFYSGTWKRLGSKSEGRLLDIVSAITGVEGPYLTGETDLLDVSFAKKMSWIAQRTTTRAEDMAYCMLGIFDINMPLLYGEGRKAFVRLQEEIIRYTYDHTMFCWAWDDNVPENWVSLLAPWPSTFQQSGKFITREIRSTATPYAMTNLGLSIGLRVLPQYTGFLAILDVESVDEDPGVAICIPIRSVKNSTRLFFRSQTSPKPILLSIGDVKGLHQEDVFVQTRPAAVPSPPGLELTSESDPYLLFTKRTEAKFVQLAGAQSRLGDIRTISKGLLDNFTGVLQMESPSREYASVICRFNMAEFGDPDSYYIFVANHTVTGRVEWDRSFWHITSDTRLRSVTLYGRLEPSKRLAKLYSALTEASFHQGHRTLADIQKKMPHVSQLPGKWLVKGTPIRPSILNLRHMPFLLQENSP